MNIIRKLITISAFAFAILFGSLAHADSASDSAATSATIKEIFEVKADYANDSAQKWLKQLFGSFIFTSNATSTEASSSTSGSNSDVTVLSTAIGFSNVLAMIFGIVVVAYMFIAGSMNTAHHGEALGKNWSSVWLPVRLATGFGLIMPAGTFGGGAVSTIQALTIWIILVGSNAANVLWNTISDKVSSGVSINSNVMLPTSVSKNLLTMLSCTYTYMNSKGNSVAFTSQGPASYTLMEGKDASGIKSLPKIDYKPDIYSIMFASNGKCGKVEFNWTSSLTGNTTDQSTSEFTFLQTAKDNGNKAAKQAFFTYLNQMIDAVNNYQNPIKSNGLGGAEGVAMKLATINTANGGSVDFSSYTTVSNQIFTAASNMSIQLPKDINTAIVTQDFASAFSTEIKKGGWGTAGLWFMRVGSVQNIISEITGSLSDTITPAIPSVSVFDLTCWSECEEKISNDIAANRLGVLTAFSKGAENYMSTAKAAQVNAEATGTSMPAVDMTINMAMEAQAGAGCDEDGCSTQTGAQTTSVGIARGILKMLAGTTGDVKIQGSSSVTDTTGIASPFATAAAMGNMSINIMQGLYGAAALGSLAEMLPIGKGGALVAKFAGSGVGGTMMTVLFGIGTYFGAIGVTLAFVIPFMPALLWMMMMIGYLLAVIEAMIASPFATIMMVTPEGEGISGTRLERAIGLLALCVLRPSLMVMGLVASITLSSVAFGIFNQFFWYTAETSITGSILTILVLVGMYTAGIFQICKHSISVMTELPNQILDWMGMNASRAFGGTDKAMDAAETGASGGTKAGQGIMDTVAKDMKRRIEKKSQ